MNRKSLPVAASEWVDSVLNSSDIASSILKVFGYENGPGTPEDKKTEATKPSAIPRIGVKVSDRDGLLLQYMIPNKTAIYTLEFHLIVVAAIVRVTGTIKRIKTLCSLTFVPHYSDRSFKNCQNRQILTRRMSQLTSTCSR